MVNPSVQRKRAQAVGPSAAIFADSLLCSLFIRCRGILIEGQSGVLHLHSSVTGTVRRGNVQRCSQRRLESSAIAYGAEQHLAAIYFVGGQRQQDPARLVSTLFLRLYGRASKPFPLATNISSQEAPSKKRAGDRFSGRSPGPPSRLSFRDAVALLSYRHRHVARSRCADFRCPSPKVWLALKSARYGNAA